MENWDPSLRNLWNRIAGDRKDSFTYEVATNEPLHPDPEIASRMVEATLSACEFGCKIYRDPRSSVRVLAHNSAYGCNIKL